MTKESAKSPFDDPNDQFENISLDYVDHDMPASERANVSQGEQEFMSAGSPNSSIFLSPDGSRIASYNHEVDTENDRNSIMQTPNLGIDSSKSLRFKIPNTAGTMPTPPTTSASSMGHSKGNTGQITSPFGESNVIFEDSIPGEMSSPFADQHQELGPDGEEYYTYSNDANESRGVDEEITKRHRWGTKRDKKGAPKKENINRSKTLRKILNVNGSRLGSVRHRNNSNKKAIKSSGSDDSSDNDEDDINKDPRDHRAEKRTVVFNRELPEEYIDPQTGKSNRSYPRNKIRTTKYTPLSFLPKNISFQFLHNIANIYFLATIIMGVFDIFGVPNPALSAVPLIVIVLMTAIKDAIEDSRRTISDLEVNNQIAYILGQTHNSNSEYQYSNNNVDEGSISLWRRFKKANSRLLFKFIDYCKYNMTKSGREEKARRKLNENQEVSGRKSFESTLQSPRSSLQYNSIDGNNIRKSFQRMRASMTGHRNTSEKVMKFHRKYWKDVRVGDIVRIYNDDEIPADVAILSTSDSDNACYVETKNLDGETNLKVKSSLKYATMANKIRMADDFINREFQINSEGPHPNLYSYNGNLEYFDEVTNDVVKESITINNMLLRGCKLRNTKWVVGIVVFTGSDTKIMLNAGVTPTKQSKISRELNYYVFLNFILLFIVCFVSGIVSGFWYTDHPTSRDYFEFGTIAGSPAKNGIVNFFVAVILFESLIPISLYITIEIIKTAQAYFIYSDIGMYYEKLDYPCTPKSWSISDDLGQIEYVFSDKTGTLTQNLMEFKKCTINGVSYGRAYTEALAGLRKRQGIDVETEAARERKLISEDRELMMNNLASFVSSTLPYHENLSFVSNDFVEDLKGANGDIQKNCNEHFMLALSLCHSVLSEEDPNNPKKLFYKAQSPDESALVETARGLGFEFRSSTKTGVLINIMGTTREFQVLNLLEFNSTRKRMSVLIKLNGNTPDEEPRVLLICKGADSVIYGRLSKDNNDPEVVASTAQDLEQFASEGLRTLCIAQRELTWSQYKLWDKKHKEAAAALDNREDKMEAVADSIERELVLLGGTAIEDKLQDGVPESISILSQAGIKLWVLTGDKVETAINIGFSCNLLGNDMELLVLRTELSPEDIQKTGITNVNTSSEEVVDRLVSYYLKEHFNMEGSVEEKEAAVLDHSLPNDGYGVVIDGDALKLVLDDPEIRRKFVLLCKQCKAVLCCRVSPAQKAGVVKSVKNTLEVMTLAIGDGSNDVAMIQAADVGVGIVGEEGRQAAMSSDYAIGQFRFLSRLLLTHGRWSYKKFSEMIPTFFYKNVIFSFALFWYGIYNDFDGSYLFEYTYLMLYNLAFTSLPIIFMCILDQDVPANVSLIVPQLYISGVLGTEWNQKKFWFYVLDAMYQSVISFFFPYLMYYKGFQSYNGLPIDHRFWVGISVNAIACVSCNLYILLHQYRWDWWSVTWVGISILVVFGWTGIWTSSIASAEFYKAAAETFGATSFWACLFAGITISLMPRFFYDCIQKSFYPADSDIVRECVQRGDFAAYPVDYDPTDPKRVKVSSYTNEYVGRISSSANSPEIKNLSGSSSDLEQAGNLDYAQSSAIESNGVVGARHEILSPDPNGNPRNLGKNSIVRRASHASRNANRQSFLKIFKRSQKKQNSPLYGSSRGSNTSVQTEEIPMEEFNANRRSSAQLRSDLYQRRDVRSSIDLPELTTMSTLHSSVNINS